MSESADNADLGLVAKSTEETIQKIEAFNAKRLENNLGLKKLILASMDIEKFYPNILSENSAKIIRRMWEESDLSINMDSDKLSRYLGAVLKKEELTEEGFEELVYTKEKKETKRKRKVTKKVKRKYVKKILKKKTQNRKNLKENSKKNKDTLDNNIGDGGADTPDTSVEKKNEIEDSKKKKKTVIWKKPIRMPSNQELRKMFGKALEIMLVLCMNNHVYKFGNKIRLQKQGGPIGLRLSCLIGI